MPETLTQKVHIDADVDEAKAELESLRKEDDRLADALERAADAMERLESLSESALEEQKEA